MLLYAVSGCFIAMLQCKAARIEPPRWPHTPYILTEPKPEHDPANRMFQCVMSIEAVFTEEDVKAGKIVSDTARLQQLVDKATAFNPRHEKTKNP